jgi:hypothetical protein
MKKTRFLPFFNFSEKAQKVTFKETLYHGEYTDFFTKEEVDLGKDFKLELGAWDYKVYVKN